MSGRLGRFLSKASEMANQVGQEYQRAREQQQQQQQQQQQNYPGLPPHPLQQGVDIPPPNFRHRPGRGHEYDDILQHYQRERDEQLRQAQEEIQRLRQQQEEQVREAEREVAHLRLQVTVAAAGSTSPAPNVDTAAAASAPAPTPDATAPASTPCTRHRHPCGTAPIRECIESPMAIELDWFVHPAAPDFLVCSRCFVDHVYDSPFRASFRRVHHGPSPPRRCLFGTPRMRDVLWPAAVAAAAASTGAAAGLRDAIAYMQRRPSIAPCVGHATRRGGDVYVAAADLPEAAICPACYEDYLAAWPAIGARFQRQAGVADGHDYCCDGSAHYLRRMTALYGPRQDWAGLQPHLRARIHMQQCSKTGDPRRLRWYVSTRPPQGLTICGACYCDYFYNGPEQGSWQEAPPPAGSPDGPTGSGPCLLGSCLNVAFPCDRALEKKDYGLFWQAMAHRSQQPPCRADGVRNGTWYTMRGAHDVAVCGACYGTMLYALEAQAWFEKSTVSPPDPDPPLCLLNQQHPRFGAVFHALLASYLCASPQPLVAQQAARAATDPPVPTTVQPCPRDSRSQGTGRRWWGWPDLRICEACYVEAVRGGGPQHVAAAAAEKEAEFAMRGERAQTGFACDLYSANMRQRFQAMDVASLRAYAQHRRQVYQHVVAQLDAMQTRSRLDRNRAHAHALQASMTTFQGDVQGLYGYDVGRAGTTGYFVNEQSLPGAMDQQAAAAEGQAALEGAQYEAQRRQLMQQWRDVE